MSNYAEIFQIRVHQGHKLRPGQLLGNPADVCVHFEAR